MVVLDLFDAINRTTVLDNDAVNAVPPKGLEFGSSNRVFLGISFHLFKRRTLQTTLPASWNFFLLGNFNRFKLFLLRSKHTFPEFHLSDPLFAAD